MQYISSSMILKILIMNMRFGDTVKDLKLHLPTVVKLKSTVTLECSFKLEESESLYSIKLYKGREEFLHFVPAFSPPYKVFSTKGVRVSWTNISLGKDDLFYKGASPFQYNLESRNTSFKEFTHGKISVILSWVNLFSSGLYSCEVSADIPDYDTKIRRQHLHVFVSPSSRPLIEGMQAHYKPGDLVNISCISPDSFPAANISWFINGSKAKSSGVKNNTIFTEKTGLLSSYSVLIIPAQEKLIIKCVASILTSFWQSIDQVVTLLEPPMSPVLIETNLDNVVLSGVQGSRVYEPTLTGVVILIVIIFNI